MVGAEPGWRVRTHSTGVHAMFISGTAHSPDPSQWNPSRNERCGAVVQIEID